MSKEYRLLRPVKGRYRTEHTLRADGLQDAIDAFTQTRQALGFRNYAIPANWKVVCSEPEIPKTSLRIRAYHHLLNNFFGYFLLGVAIEVAFWGFLFLHFRK